MPQLLPLGETLVSPMSDQRRLVCSWRCPLGSTVYRTGMGGMKAGEDVLVKAQRRTFNPGVAVEADGCKYLGTLTGRAGTCCCCHCHLLWQLPAAVLGQVHRSVQ